MGNFGALLLVLFAFLVAHLIRFQDLQPNPSYLIALLLTLLLCSVVFPATGAFRPEFRWALLRRVRRLVAGWALVVMLLVAIAALTKTTAVYSRIWFGWWVLFGALFLLLGQFAEITWLRRKRAKPGSARRVVLVGAGYAAARVEQRITGDVHREFELVGSFGRAWPGTEARPLAELPGFLDAHRVDDVWIAAPLEEPQMLDATLDMLRERVVNVHVIPDLHQYRLLNQGISEWSGLPVINLSGTPMTGAEMRIKAVLDRLIALLALVALSPLLLLIALAIRLEDGGPALFHQRRHGIGGETIDVLKFRTMRQHSEPSGQVTQAIPHDTRVTRVGRMLRKTSLDELPQLINVLKGEMSLVGPRPHAIEHNSFYSDHIPRYMLRHKVKPGLTGWAQVNGYRGITDTPEKMEMRIEHDLWYIQNWSLWLDLRILLMTPLVMVHRNAV